MTVDVLPDESLLDIFDLYREAAIFTYIVESAWGWTTLSHVCRRWRAIIFASPQRLHLRITCSPRTPVKTSLDIWPPFPIAITSAPYPTVVENGEENVFAALEHRDRISVVHLFDAAGTSLKRWVVAMQEPLPALTDLYCNAERCLRAEFGDVPQVTREGGRGRKAAIPKIRERADGDREKRRCRCVGVERWRVDVMRRRR